MVCLWLALVPLLDMCNIERIVLFTYDTSMKFGTVSGAIRKKFGYWDIADSPRDKNGNHFQNGLQKLTCLTDYSMAGTTGVLPGISS